MSIVSIDPKSADRPYLKLGGEYGAGRNNGGEVECVAFEYPAEAGPGYDRESRDDTYCQFTFTVKHPDFGFVSLRHWEGTKEGSGSRALEFIRNLGVEVGDQGEFDDSQVAPRKCAIEVRDPRQGNDGRWWTGNVSNVFGI